MSNQPPAESEKSRARRQPTSLRVINDHLNQLNEGEQVILASQPTLLSQVYSVSSGPCSPSAAHSPPMLNANSRSNSHMHSTSSSNRRRGYSNSTGSSSFTRYQENDARVSLVIEEGVGHEVLRTIPPAYVDYRRASSSGSHDGVQPERRTNNIARAEGSTSALGASSGAGHRNDSMILSATFVGSSTVPTRPPSIKRNGTGLRDTDTVDARTVTETNTVREPTRGRSEQRDRNAPGDSEDTTMARSLQEAGSSMPAEQSAARDLAAPTTPNMIVNRPRSSSQNSSYVLDRPPSPVHTPAPAGVTLSDSPSEGQHVAIEHGNQVTVDKVSRPTGAEGSSTSSNSGPWGWSRVLGFGLSSSSAGGS